MHPEGSVQGPGCGCTLMRRAPGVGKVPGMNSTIRNALTALALTATLTIAACGGDGSGSGAAGGDGASTAEGSAGEGKDGLSVIASFYPIEYLVERVAGDHAEVSTLTSPGVDPHDVELTLDAEASRALRTTHTLCSTDSASRRERDELDAGIPETRGRVQLASATSQAHCTTRRRGARSPRTTA